MQPQYLAITALSQDLNLLHYLTETCKQLNCQIISTRMSLLGKDQATLLHVSGPWNVIAKLEQQLATFNKDNPNQNIVVKRTESREFKQPMVSYLIHVTATDRPEVASLISGFFAEELIVVSEFVSSRYIASQTNQAMQAISMTLLIPAELPLAELRESFILFCDEYNIDAIFEPDRS